MSTQIETTKIKTLNVNVETSKQIDDLLKMLKSSNERRTKMKIRRQLRRLKHYGALMNRQCDVERHNNEIDKLSKNVETSKSKSKS